MDGSGNSAFFAGLHKGNLRH